jgi:hypothetical protein
MNTGTFLNGNLFLPKVIALFLLSWLAHAQTTQPRDPPAGLDKIEQMIRSRPPDHGADPEHLVPSL